MFNSSKHSSLLFIAIMKRCFLVQIKFNTDDSFTDIRTLQLN
jgi:hypothetical protein